MLHPIDRAVSFVHAPLKGAQGGRMKIVMLCTVAMLFVFGIFAAQKGETFSGEIMDSACAQAGSHAGMMKTNPDIKSAKDCTLGCVQHGAKFVLYDSASKKVYQLDDQKRPEEFAGDKVKITGTFEKSSNTIHVSDIK